MPTLGLTIITSSSPASPIDYLKLPIQTLKVGALGTHKTLGLAKAKGARFLIASTSEVYGDPQVHPQPESYWGHVNPVGPRGVYDESKRFAEAMAMAYHRYHGVETRIVRIFNTYGPRMRLKDGRVVPNFIAQALSGEPLTVYGDGSRYPEIFEASEARGWDVMCHGIYNTQYHWNMPEDEERAVVRLLAQGAGQGAGQPLEAWDVAYWSERFRQEELKLSDEELKPYFPLEQMLQALFHTAEELFGVTLELDESILSWHPDVRFYWLADASGRRFAGIYMDLFSRKDKRGGAWMSNYRDASSARGEVVRPIVTNNMNVATILQDNPDCEIVVAGGGDSAMEEGTYLTKFASKVTIVHRRDELRASKIMQDRAFANPKIEFLWNSRVTDIFGDTSVTGVEITNTVDGTVSTLPVTGLFVAIGHRPNTELFRDQLEMNDEGYILTRNGTKTNVSGVFAAGDVQDQQFRQAVTAAGTGCMAAIQAERSLDNLPYDPSLSCKKGVCKPKD